MWTIVVGGTPQQKGSKQPYGGGRVDANPKAAAWQDVVRVAAREQYDDLPMEVPLEIVARFYFPRPRKHYRGQSMRLRDDAPLYCDATPDLDKCQRVIGDALEGVVYQNDKQIVRWLAEKCWSDPEHAGVHLTISAIGEDDEDDDEFDGVSAAGL